EITRTDVAQAESRLAAGQSQMQLAEGNYIASRATYRQVIGSEPGKLAAGMPVDRFSPKTLPAAISAGRETSPAVTSAMYSVDVSVQAVKIAESTLSPTVNVQGSIAKNWGSQQSLNVIESYSYGVVGQLSVPIYKGGAEYATIRQTKETLGQARLN